MYTHQANNRCSGIDLPQFCDCTILNFFLAVIFQIMKSSTLNVCYIWLSLSYTIYENMTHLSGSDSMQRYHQIYNYVYEQQLYNSTHTAVSVYVCISVCTVTLCERRESVYVCGIVCDFSSDKQCMSIITTPSHPHTLSLTHISSMCSLPELSGALYLRAASSLISRYLCYLLTLLTTVTPSKATA